MAVAVPGLCWAASESVNATTGIANTVDLLVIAFLQTFVRTV